jgi:hypothetical protein
LTRRDDGFHVRPGRIRHGDQSARRPKSFVGEVMRAAKKAGHIGQGFGRSGARASGSRFGRGRRAALSLSLHSTSRRVVMKARVVGHHGTRFRSAPLPKHIASLKREGVTRDAADARTFDAKSDAADERAPSPNGARRIGIISGSSFRRKTPPGLRISARSRASCG